MAVTRRNFLESAAVMGMLASLLTPEQLHAMQETVGASATTTGPVLPHNSPQFWGGFYGSVNPSSQDYGKATRGAESLADPDLETQYFHYLADKKKLRYANSIGKSELLNHDGDVSVSILMNQYRASKSDATNKNASQLRVDTTQNYPFMNLLAPLAWTAMASLEPNNAGKLPTLDQLHFKSDEVMNASSHILLTQGSGKLAVNISQAPKDSGFIKVLGFIISAAKIGAPMVALPAVSVPAMSAFSEAFSYWEARTKFILNGNLTNAVATQQAMSDPEIRPPYIGLIPGDYVVVAKKDTAALEAAMPKLMVYQGYLVSQDTDLSTTSVDEAKEDPKVPDITYATVRVGVSPLNGASGAAGAKPATTDTTTPATTTAPPKKPVKPGY